jgi:hypothetical protein
VPLYFTLQNFPQKKPQFSEKKLKIRFFFPWGKNQRRRKSNWKFRRIISGAPAPTDGNGGAKEERWKT